MSDTDLTNKLTELSIETRRKIQFAHMKKWEKGLISGRECIEELVALEKMIYINQKDLKKLRGFYEQTTGDTSESKKS